LAHRLGFIPIVGNHEAMRSMKWHRSMFLRGDEVEV
jgi:hypothetical protein